MQILQYNYLFSSYFRVSSMLLNKEYTSLFDEAREIKFYILLIINN